MLQTMPSTCQVLGTQKWSSKAQPVLMLLHFCRKDVLLQVSQTRHHGVQQGVYTGVNVGGCSACCTCRLLSSKSRAPTTSRLLAALQAGRRSLCNECDLGQCFSPLEIKTSGPTISPCNRWHGLLFSSCVWILFPPGPAPAWGGILLGSKPTCMSAEKNVWISKAALQARNWPWEWAAGQVWACPSLCVYLPSGSCSVDKEQPTTLLGTCLCVSQRQGGTIPSEDHGHFSMKLDPCPLQAVGSFNKKKHAHFVRASEKEQDIVIYTV